MIAPALQQGIHGLQTARQGMSQAAETLASATTRSVDEIAAGPNGAAHDIAGSLVHLQESLQLFTASAAVVSTSDAMTGSLLDIIV